MVILMKFHSETDFFSSCLPFSVSLTKAPYTSLEMDRWFDIGDQKVYIKELILSGELGTQIWDAVRFDAFNTRNWSPLPS